MKNILKKTELLFCLFIIISLSSCGGSKVSNDTSIKLHYLDEYIIPEDLTFEGTKIGGLSDLDYDGENFYTVCDLPSSPHIYEFSIHLKHNKIDTVRFNEVIKINHKSGEGKSLRFDSEGILFDPIKHQFTLSSEGSISKEKNPFIVELDAQGNVIDQYHIPDYFKATQKKGLRNNGVFEGLDRSVDGRGIWVSTELPMKMDGPTAKLYSTHSPVRFTYFNKETKQPEKQFAYLLGRLRKVPLLPFGMNGVSAIKEYKPEQFLVLERAFSAGHGRRGIRARLYQVDARKATNTLKIKKLKKKIGKSVQPAKKKLVYDFNQIRKKLTDKVIDNLEGIAFGPILANGHQSLILLSDNNFSSFTKQLNQIILLEIIPQ